MKEEDQKQDKPKRKLPKKKQQSLPTPSKKPGQKPILNLDIVDKLKDEAKTELVTGKTVSPETIRQISKASEVLTRSLQQYDFSSMVKSVPTLEELGFTKDFFLINKHISESLVIPTDALAAIQKNLVLHTIVASQLADFSSLALTMRSMFAEIQLSHQRIFRSFTIDLSTIAQSALMPNERLIIADYTVDEQDGKIIASGQAVQTKRVGDYSIVHNADIELIFTELRANRSEIRELKRLLTAPGDSEPSRVEYADVKFRREGSHLVIHGFEVGVSRSSAQARFCDLFFSSPKDFTKKWDIVEALSAVDGFHIGIDGTERDAISKIKGYVNALNGKIKGDTKGQFPHFFILQGLEVYINPHYLSNL